MTHRIATGTLLALLGCLFTSPVSAGAVEPTVISKILGCERPAPSTCPALASAARDDLAGTISALVARLQAVDADSADAGRTARRAAVALSSLGAREHAAAIRQRGLALQDPAARVEVLAAAARLGDDAAAAPLVAAVSDIKLDSASRTLAAGGLGVLRAPSAIKPLLSVIEAADTGRRLLLTAVLAVGRTAAAAGTPAATRRQVGATLVELAARGTVYTPARATALEALAELADQRARPLAAALVEHPSRSVGLGALAILGALPATWTGEALERALRIPGRRAAAIDAAAEMPKGAERDSFSARVAELCRTGDLLPEEFAGVARGVAALKPMNGGVGLLRLLDDAPDDETRVAVLRALAKLGDKTVLPSLLPLLEAPSRLVVDNTVYALERLSGRHLGDDTSAWRLQLGADQVAPPADKDNAPAAP
jgi:HEAT repeat protein